MSNDFGKERFRIAFDWLLSVEGGYVDDPDDRGGPTNYGISQRAHPDLDVAHLTIEEAETVYWSRYWLLARCDKLPEPLDLALFDSVCQHGVKPGVKLLQQVLRVIIDGDNGPVTQAAAHARTAACVLNDLLTSRALLYCDLTVAISSQSKFLRGWLHRLFALQQAALGKGRT